MATFTIGGTAASFVATIQGSSQEADDVEKLTLGVRIDTEAEWLDFLALVTTKYHIHVPLGGVAILDIVRGPGLGTLVVGGLGTCTALLTAVRRSRWVPLHTFGSADFLVTSVWT